MLPDSEIAETGKREARTNILEARAKVPSTAISRDGRFLYVAEMMADSVAVIDLQAGTVLQRVQVDPYPYGIVLDTHNRIYVSSWGGSTIWAIQAISVPTLGIGAGPDCDGQVLVLNDVLGLVFKQPAKFVRRYLDGSSEIAAALARFKADVESRKYPTDLESYHLSSEVACHIPEIVSRIRSHRPREHGAHGDAG